MAKITFSPSGPALSIFDRAFGDMNERYSVLRLWQAGEHLSPQQRGVVDDLMLRNRVDLMASSYEFTRRVA